MIDAATMVDASTPKLRIYLHGASKGETIVLHLPDGRWGIVDYYNPNSQRPHSHLALELLKSRDVQEIAFVCLTHPHDDHFRGMSYLLKNFKVEAFWSLCGLDPVDFKLLKTYFKAAAQWAKNRPKPKEVATELGSIFDAVEASGCRHEYVSSCRLLYPSPLDEKAEFKVWGLAPSSKGTLAYKRMILKSFRGGVFRGPLPHVAHNAASVALRLDFKETRVILGGDVESVGWKDVMRDHASDVLTSDIVKISHHGSTNGYCESLVRVLRTTTPPIPAPVPANRRSFTNRSLEGGSLSTSGRRE